MTNNRHGNNFEKWDILSHSEIEKRQIIGEIDIGQNVAVRHGICSFYFIW
jgi:hypothetical protein